jgi:cytochrome c
MMQSGSTTRFARLAMCVVVSALTLAACSKPDDDSDATAAPNATATGATAAPTAAAAAPAAAAPAADNTDTVTGVKLASYTGDAAKGEAVFLQCKTCHDPVVNKIGPHLDGVVGRHSGSVADFNYSAANKNSGITWTPDKLFQYLENPQRVIPGTKMAFTGVSDPQKRADLIKYLETLK